jgi:uncharacterized protein (DUF3820 family)
MFLSLLNIEPVLHGVCGTEPSEIREAVLATIKMPFGRYQGTALIDLLGLLYEIKVNGLEDLIRKLKVN